MNTDTDLIGIIAASCVMSLFIIGLTLVLAKVCYSRMERKRKQQIVKNISVRWLETENDYELRSVEIPPEIASQVPRRLSAYRPKILSEEEEAEYHRHLTQVNSQESGLSNHRNNTPRRHYEQIGTSEFENVAAIMNADNSDENGRYEYDRREIRANGFINEGYAPVSYHQNFVAQTIDDNFNGLIENRQGPVRIMEQSINNGIKDGYVDSSSGRNVSLGGHIIKHIVTDGRHVLQHKNDNGVTNQCPRKNNVYLPNSPTDVESIQRFIGHSSENTDGSMFVSKSSSKDNEDIIIKETVGNVKSVFVEHTSPNISINKTFKDKQFINASRDTSDNGEYIRRQARDYLITQEANDDGWESDDDEEIEKHVKVHKQTELTVAVHQDNDVDRWSPEIPGSSNGNLRVSRQEDNVSARSSRRGDDSMSLFYSDSNNYKVIKKHSAYKPPDWLVQTYAESAAAADHVTSSTQSVGYVETARVVNGSQEDAMEFVEASIDLEDEDVPSVKDLNLGHPQPDYTDDEELFTIVDYVDYDSGEVGRAVADKHLVG